MESSLKLSIPHALLVYKVLSLVEKSKFNVSIHFGMIEFAAYILVKRSMLLCFSRIGNFQTPITLLRLVTG